MSEPGNADTNDHGVDWDTLGEKAGRGELAPVPGAMIRGADAAARGRAMLFEASETDNFDYMVRIALGSTPPPSKDGHNDSAHLLGGGSGDHCQPGEER